MGGTGNTLLSPTNKGIGPRSFVQVDACIFFGRGRRPNGPEGQTDLACSNALRCTALHCSALAVGVCVRSDASSPSIPLPFRTASTRCLAAMPPCPLAFASYVHGSFPLAVSCPPNIQGGGGLVGLLVVGERSTPRELAKTRHASRLAAKPAGGTRACLV